MSKATLLLCSVFLLLASPTFLTAEQASTTPVNDFGMNLAEVNGCGTSLQSKVESSTDLVIDALQAPLFMDNATALGGAPSCGNFPIRSPGACVQSRSPCTGSASCPRFGGRPRKCCSYCP